MLQPATRGPSEEEEMKELEQLFFRKESKNKVGAVVVTVSANRC